MKLHAPFDTMAINLRKSGLSYPQIETELYKAGLRGPNGSRVHNANISAEVIKLDPSLRVRAPRRKKKAYKTINVKAKRTYTKKIKTVSPNQKIIDALKSAGASDDLIVKALRSL